MGSPPTGCEKWLRGEGICVPAYWALDVCNTRLAAARHGFITMLELRELAPDLRLLPEAIDRQADAAA